MKLPIVNLVFDRKNVADDYKNPKRNKKGLLQIEVYYERQRRFFSTGVKLYKGQWSELKGVVNHPDSFHLNNQIKALVTATNESIAHQVQENGGFSFSELDTALNNSTSSRLIRDVLIQIHDEYVELGKSYSTCMYYSALATLLDEWGKIVTVEDLTYNNIDLFDKYMRVQKDYSDNTVWGYHCKLRHACVELVNKGVIHHSPYERFKLKKPKNDEVRYLTQDEIDKIKKLPLEKEGEKYVRDFFLFQTMTGMSYSDVYQLNIDDIVERDGKHILIDWRIKTDVQYSIVIMHPAYELLVKHGGSFDLYTLQHINEVLHDIGERAIGRRITSHQGRHSFATWALRNNVPIEYVSKMLGHTNIQTTQRYAKVLAQDVIDQFDKLEEALTGKSMKVPVKENSKKVHSKKIARKRGV